MNSQPETNRFRTIFISDIHLGSKDCQAIKLLDFLKNYDADVIYLVGDIIDGWKLRRNWYWPQSHNDVVQKLLRKARKGTRIIYIPGNHDEFMRDFLELNFGEIEIYDQIIHETASGKTLLVVHGDQFDVVVAHAKWLAYFGDKAYSIALWSNRWVNATRRRLGLPYWSLSAWAKLKVKKAVNFISRFEHFLVAEARSNKASGVVCGHIHHAADRRIDGIRYLNCGDWVESCSAIVEYHDGSLELLSFSGKPAASSKDDADASACSKSASTE